MPGTAAGPLALLPGGSPWDAELALVAADGVRLRGALWHHGAGAPPRGLVLLLPGRTEFLEKYTRIAVRLRERGFAVASLDWRGQGLSERLLPQPLKGHVGAFDDYGRDLAALMAHPAVAAVSGPRLMLANSMGGAIGLAALHRGQLRVQAAVLVSPMLGIALTPFQQWLQRLLLPLARTARSRAAWPPLPGRARPYVLTGFEDNVLTADRDNFEWVNELLHTRPALQIAMPTLGWLAAARREMDWLGRQGPVGCPALWLVGSREAVVDPGALRAAARRAAARLHEIPGARHDILMEAQPMLGEAWEQIDRFLDEAGF